MILLFTATHLNTILIILFGTLALFVRKGKRFSWSKRFGREIDEFQRVSIQLHNDALALNTYIAVNKEFLIVFANERCKKMFGWKEDELLGKSLDIMFPNYQKLIDFIKEHPVIEDETLLQIEGKTKDERKLYLELISGKWTDEIASYYTVVIRDITHRIKNEETKRMLQDQINAYRELYTVGELVGCVGFWKMNSLTGKLETTPGFGELFGVTGVEFQVEDMVKRVMADDKEKVALTMKEAKDNKTGYRMTYRMNGWDGYINHLESTTKPFFTDGIEVYRIGMARLVKKEKPSWL